MTDIKDWLRPVSGKHAIKEAVISLFLSSPIIKPERFKTLITGPFKERFQQFQILNNVEVTVAGDEEGQLTVPQSLLHKDQGFRFTQFQEGAITAVLQGVNDRNRYYFSYHSLAYERWIPFYSDFVSLISDITNFQASIFVEAFSLHYVDEFQIHKVKLVPEELFNKASSLLPKDFFDHQLFDYQITNVKSKEEVEFLDRLEIKIESRPEFYISISNNIIRNLKEAVSLDELIAGDEMRKMLDFAHQQNKQTLKTLLVPEVCRLINLT